MLDGRPEIKEYFVDSKKHVDRQLKLACEDFIESQSKFLIGQLQDFLTRAGVIVEMAKKDPNGKVKIQIVQSNLTSTVGSGSRYIINRCFNFFIDQKCNYKICNNCNFTKIFLA